MKIQGEGYSLLPSGRGELSVRRVLEEGVVELGDEAALPVAGARAGGGTVPELLLGEEHYPILGSRRVHGPAEEELDGIRGGEEEELCFGRDQGGAGVVLGGELRGAPKKNESE